MSIERTNATIVDYVYNENQTFEAKRKKYFLKESESNLIFPLRVISLLIAVSGLFAMVFEVRYFSEYSLEVYLVRFTATIVSFVILWILYNRHPIKRPVILVHILLLTIILSSGYMIMLIPSTLIVNSQIVGLMIFTSALFLSWDVKHQIIVAIYYNIVFAAAILMNDKDIYFLPNMYESVLFVIFLSVIAVIGSTVNFKLRSELADKSLRVKLSERKFRSIFEHSAEGIFQSSPEGKLLTVNPALVKMLGYSNEEELKQIDISRDLYVKEADRDRLLSLLMHKGEISNYRVPLKKKDGSILIARVSDRVIRDENDEKIYFEGSIADITEQVRLEEEQAKIQEELKFEKQKSEQLAHEAVKSSEIKSQFLANMSHEIRTPINGIIGFLTLIENNSYTDENELREFISNAKNSAETLLELINDILDFSKIEAGKLELEEISFSLQKVIKDALNIVSPKANEKGLKVLVNFDRHVPPVLLGDSTRLRQIYLNLLSNAIKFTSRGEIRIQVVAEKIGYDKVKITSSVQDSGVGIPQEKIDQLFKPFSQVDGSYTRKYGGTGLGLAITKELVNMMSGSIWVESQLGKGSTFYFTSVHKFAKQASFLDKLKNKTSSGTKQVAQPANTVNQQPPLRRTPVPLSKAISESKPLVKIDESQQAKEFISITPEAEKKPVQTDAVKKERSKYRILIAEDNAVNKKVVLRILTDAGFIADAVSNGLEAVEAMMKSANKYNLILMDIQMPGMDGFTATQKIRQLGPKFSALPIIALTAHALAGDREKCLAAGMNDYITKPIKNQDLISMLDKWFEIDYSVVQEEPPAETIPAEADLFDREHFSSISADDKDFQQELLSTYLSDTKKRIERLEELFAQKNLPSIVSESHTVKGASYSIGAKQMGDIAKEIEFAGKNNDLSIIGDRLTALKKSFNATSEILRQYLS